MSNIQISEKYFLKFKELTRKKIGKEEYNKMTEQELFASFTALVTLMEAVYKHINKENYEKFLEKEKN